MRKKIVVPKYAQKDCCAEIITNYLSAANNYAL